MYRVVVIEHPTENIVIHIGREKQSGNGRYLLNRLLTESRHRGVGARHELVRTLLAAGKEPHYSVVDENLTVDAAKRLVDELREKHGVQISRKGSKRPRVHQKMDPNSPYLDKSKIYYVYELIRPDKDEVFYVGKGSAGQPPRINSHIQKAKRGKKGHKFSIIRKLLKAGLTPIERRVYSNLCESDALKKEVEWIAHHGLNKLTNVTEGGQTAPTGDDHWTRKHPEKVLRGENHPWAKDPELAKKNIKKMQDALKADSSKRPRGAKHGMAKLTRKQVDQIRSRYQEGLDSGTRVTGRRLAADYGVTSTQISRVLHGSSWGLPSLIKTHGNAKLSVEQLREIKRLRAAGEPYSNIAVIFNVTTNAIFSICNPGPPKRRNTTDRPGNAKLTVAQIEEMAQRDAMGEPRKDLAAAFEVSYSQVWRILKTAAAV